MGVVQWEMHVACNYRFKSDLNKSQFSGRLQHRVCRGSSHNPLQEQGLMSFPPHTATDLHDSKPKVVRGSECEGERLPFSLLGRHVWLCLFIISIIHLLHI